MKTRLQRARNTEKTQGKRRKNRFKTLRYKRSLKRRFKNTRGKKSSLILKSVVNIRISIMISPQKVPNILEIVLVILYISA